MMRTARQSWGRTPDSGRMALPVALPLTAPSLAAASTGGRDKGTATLEKSGAGRVQRVADGGGRGGRRWPGLHSGKVGQQVTGIRERG